LHQRRVDVQRARLPLRQQAIEAATPPRWLTPASAGWSG
jgi:hypothetical protein